MVKEIGAFSLTIFMFVLLTSWWTISVFQQPQQMPLLSATKATAQANVAAAPLASPIVIYHSSSKGVQHYTGNITIPDCAQFLTGISATGANPTHLHMDITVSPTNANCSSSASASVPFSITYSSKSASKPVLDSVEINNEASAFSVVESK